MSALQKNVGFFRRSAEYLEKLKDYNVNFLVGAFERSRNKRASENWPPTTEQVLRETPCCFVLSTGRCGTKLLAKILAKSRQIYSVHVGTPELVAASVQAYMKINTDVEAVALAVLGARFDLLQEAWARGRMLVETNPRLTFFSPAVSRLFEKSKFIHLVRHPGDFARSILRRHYYTDEMIADFLLRPREDSPVHAQWAQMSRTEKVAWVWNEVQCFAESFKKEVGDDRVLTVRSEDLFSDVDTTCSVFEFLGVGVPLSRRKIARLIARPVNAKKGGTLSAFRSWPDEEKNALKRWLTIASEYGYDLK